MRMESSELEIKLFDYNLYKFELIELRKCSWNATCSKINSALFISDKDDIIDASSIHCGVFYNEKLVASHRLQPINKIEELPFSENFEKSKVVDFEWHTYGENGANYVPMTPPVVSTGRLVIHPEFRKKGLAKQILSFWIEYSKNNNIKSLLSYPSPWMVKSLLDVGFTSEKDLGKVFNPLPTIDITLVIKKF